MMSTYSLIWENQFETFKINFKFFTQLYVSINLKFTYIIITCIYSDMFVVCLNIVALFLKSNFKHSFLWVLLLMP